MGRIILTNVGHLSKLRPCYSIEEKRETQLTTKLFVCGNFSRLKDNRWFRLNLDSNMEFLLLITSREVSGRRAGPREKRGRKREKKRLFKSMLLDGSKGVWNNKDKTRDPPEASRKTKLRLSNRLSKYRDEISIDGLSGIDASGVDRKKESRQTRRRRKNFFLTRIKIFDELYSRNR